MRRLLLLILPLLVALGALTGILRGVKPADASPAPPPAVGPLDFSTTVTDRLALQGHVGGPAGGVDVEGAVAAATYGSVFAALEVGAFGGMTRTGSLPLSAPAGPVLLEGDTAFVGTDGDGLAVIDLTDPASPLMLTAVLDTYSVYGLARGQNTLLIAAGSSGVWLLDVADHALPVPVGTALTGTEVRGVSAGGKYAYGVTAGGDLAVIDVSAPMTPTVPGTVSVGPVGGGVAAASGYAYVSWSECDGGTCSAHLSVVDVGTPGDPQVVTTRLLGDGRAGAVAVAAGYAYVTRSRDGGIQQGPAVDVLDIATPDFPVVVQGIDIAGAYGAADVVVQGTTALVAYGYAGVRRYDISDPTAPLPDGRAAGPGRVRAVEPWGDGWLVGAGDGVGRGELWYVTPPGQATLLAAVSGPPVLIDIAVDGSLVAVAGPTASGGRLQLVDLTTPAAPLLLGAWDGDISNGIALASGLVAASGAAAVRLLDVSEPLTPTLVGSHAPAGPAVLSGTLLAVAAGDAGLHLVDVSNPAAPQAMGVFDPAWPVLDVGLDGSVALAASGAAGLYTVDISDPAQPALLGGIDPVWPVPAVALYEAGVLVPAGADGAYVVEIADPAAPVAAGQYVDGRNFASGAGWRDRVALGTESDGLFLLRQHFDAAGAVRQANGLPWPGALLSSGGIVTGSGADGAYRFDELVSGTYTISPEHPELVFTPTEQIVSLPPNGTGIDFTILPPPRATTVGVSGTELVFTDTQGVTTTLSIPAGAVSTSLALFITPTIAADAPGFLFAGHAFDLGPADLAFDRPVSVTIAYTADDVGAIIEEELLLRYQSGGTWGSAGDTCVPSIPDGVSGGRYRTAICTGGRFALFGSPRLWLLPVIVNSE